MHKAAYMAVIFTLGLWTGGIFAPSFTPAAHDQLAPAAPAAHVAGRTPPRTPESPERVQP